VTFLNAAFLFAALAALLPLVIHLISRRRVETVDWSSLRFLKELERRRIRRVRIRQILLLVIRSLIILCVALALARPTLEGPLAGSTARARTSVAVVLDESASMLRETGGAGLPAAARTRVGEIVAMLDEGDEAFLVSAAAPAASVIPDGTVSPDILARALERRGPTAAATDYTGAVEAALGHLADARNINREVYIVGDLQRSGWDGGVDVPAAPEEQPGWPPRAYLLGVSGTEANSAVTSVTVERVYGGTAGRYGVTAEIVGTGPRPTEFPVRLFVDGVQVGQTGVVAGGGSATARFTTTLDESAWHAGRVAVEGDAFAVDDERFFVVPPSRSVEVLVVAPEGAGDDAAYVRRALDPTGVSERFRPVVIDAAELPRQEQGRFPVVVLADVGRLGDASSRWIRRHVESGGGLLVVLGNRTDVRAWPESDLADLTGVDLLGPVERRGGFRLAPAGRGHPLLEGLTTGERLIEDVFVRRALEGETTEEVVLELPGVGPALTFADRRDGRTAAFLLGLERSAGDLPRSGLVVPLLHRVTDRLAGPAPGAGSGPAGRPLELPLAEAPAGRIDVEAPGGTTVVAQATRGRFPSVLIEDTTTTGIYRVISRGRTVAMAAVNVDPEESSLAPAGAGEIEDWLDGIPLVVIGPDESVADAVMTSRRGRELWRVFLYAALALLFVEMILARPRPA